MVETVDLATLESDRRSVGAIGPPHHAQLLRPGEGPERSPQGHQPGRPGIALVGRRRRRCCNQVVPVGMGREVGKDRPDRLGRGVDADDRRVLHPISVPASTITAMTPGRESTTIDLDALDLVELGGGSGLFWRSERISIVGLGATRLVGAGQRAIDDRDVLAPDEVAFAAWPFDPTGRRSVMVPEAAVVEDASGRRIVGSPDAAAAHIATLEAAPPPSEPERIHVHSLRRPGEWRDDVVGTARQRVRSGELTKVVVARQLVLTADGPIPVSGVLRRLARAHKEGYVFAVDGFVGASPELLVARDGRRVRALPLAGTAARSPDPVVDADAVEELRRSTKDQMEHRITIEWLLEALLPFCSYVDAEPEPSIVSMPTVHHLATVVEGVLSMPVPSVLALVDAVHPTPALGGDPAEVALRVIDELEGFDRGRYGGPVGWIDGAGNGEFAVGVRSAQIVGRTARVAAGVGVVADSDPEAELRETQAKFRAALGALLGS